MNKTEKFPKYFTPLSSWTEDTVCIKFENIRDYGVYFYRDGGLSKSHTFNYRYIKELEQRGETKEIPPEEACLLF